MGIDDLALVKKLRNNTLETIISKFGTGLGQLDKMKLSIWDVKTIIYEEARKIAEEEMKKSLDKW